MVQLTPPVTSERIEHELGYARREWGAIPSYVAAWEQWDEDERLDFVIEWPIRESALTLLRGWASQGLLTLDQRREYEDILCTVAKYRPLLAPLLAD